MPQDKLILVGQVAGGFGVKGEVRVTAYTAEPRTLLSWKTLLRTDSSPGLTLTGGRAEKSAIVGRAQEITTKEEADALRGLKLHVLRDRLPAPDEDEFYLTDLIGLEVRDAAGEVLGRVRDVPNFGAGDLLEITPALGGQTWFLAFTRETVPELHIADGWLSAVPPVEVGEPEAGDAKVQ